MIRFSMRYQLRDQVQAAGMYYLIYLAIILLITALVSTSADSSGSFSGMETSTTIFLFVMGLVSFREPFHMLLQNGISRRTLFISRLLTVVGLCVAMAAIDSVLMGVSRAMTAANAQMKVYSLYDLAYPGTLGRMNGFGQWVTRWALMVTQSLMATCLGYCITLAYYRMNKLTKWLVSFGVPALLIVALTRMNMSALGRALSAALGLERQLPLMAMLTFLAMAAVFSGGSWLLLRRAPVR